MDERPNPGMDELQRKKKRSISEIPVSDERFSGLEPARNPKAPSSELDEVTRASEHQGRIGDGKRQGHPNADADIFFKSGWTRKALCRVDDLREAVAPAEDARPVLTARRAVLRHRDDRR